MAKRQTYSESVVSDICYIAKTRTIGDKFGHGMPIGQNVLDRRPKFGAEYTEEEVKTYCNRDLTGSDLQSKHLNTPPLGEILEDLYQLNRGLLIAVLCDSNQKRCVPMADIAVVAAVGRLLDSEGTPSATTLAHYTNLLFTGIASLGNNSDIVDIVNYINSGLSYIRAKETSVLTSVRLELINICELFLESAKEDLVRKLSQYHDRRILSIPTLLTELGL